MRDHSTLHLIAVLHFSVTVGSSTMGNTYTPKWVWNGP